MKNLNLSTLFLILFIVISNRNSNAQNTLDCTGPDDYVNLGDNYNFQSNQAFSMEAWVKVGPSTEFNTIMAKFDMKGWKFEVTNNAQGGTVALRLIGGDPVDVISRKGQTNIRDHQWHHVAVSYNGSQSSNGIRIYIDGNEETDNAASTNLAGNGSIANNSDAFIGATNLVANGTLNPYTGVLDELRIWSGVRSGFNFNQFKDEELSCLPQENLIGYYQFNEGVADGNNQNVTTLPDLSGNQIDGTLEGFGLNGVGSNWAGGQPLGGPGIANCDCISTNYCVANGLDDNTLYINSVSTVQYDNLNTGPSGGYGDYRGEEIELVAGSVDVLKVTRGVNGGIVGIAAWVDWNQDGVFDDQTERIMGIANSSNAVALKVFNVPNTALAGHTRMRIVSGLAMGITGLPNSCGNIAEGEVEDYCVHVRHVAGGGTGGGVQAPPSAQPFPNPILIGSRLTTTTTSPITIAVLVNPTTGQSTPLTVLSSQTSATGGVSSQLLIPTSLSMGLYNLVLFTQDGTNYSDNIRIR